LQKLRHLWVHRGKLPIAAPAGRRQNNRDRDPSTFSMFKRQPRDKLNALKKIRSSSGQLDRVDSRANIISASYYWGLATGNQPLVESIYDGI